MKARASSNGGGGGSSAYSSGLAWPRVDVSPNSLTFQHTEHYLFIINNIICIIFLSSLFRRFTSTPCHARSYLISNSVASRTPFVALVTSVSPSDGRSTNKKTILRFPAEKKQSFVFPPKKTILRFPAKKKQSFVFAPKKYSVSVSRTEAVTRRPCYRRSKQKMPLITSESAETKQTEQKKNKSNKTKITRRIIRGARMSVPARDSVRELDARASDCKRTCPLRGLRLTALERSRGNKVNSTGSDTQR